MVDSRLSIGRKISSILIKSRFTLVLLALLFAGFSYSQEITQSVRGQVLDARYNTPIQDGVVQLIDVQTNDPLLTVETDSNGRFVFSEVPVGRVHVKAGAPFHVVEFKEDVLVNSAQEVIVEFKLEYSLKELETVEIDATTMRSEPINRMAIASAKVITPEMTEKLAGSWDDPMRVVTAYGGVVQQSSGFNHFSVRGHSPVGMLYRVEGVPVYNPNHFAEIGATGGFVTQFSSALLSTSDFYSGVFPAEFGNATNSVFDFRFRKGNNQNREHSLNANVFGLDLATEGPFSKNSKASYLINYRYSTLGVLAQIVDVGGVRPQYQDLSANIYLPTERFGDFSVFAIGGLSNLLIEAERDTAEWTEFGSRVERQIGSNSGTVGLVHRIPVSEKGYIHSVLSGSIGEYFDSSDYLERDLSWSTYDVADYNTNRITFTTDYNHQFSKRHSNKTGVILSYIDHEYLGQYYNRTGDTLVEFANTQGEAMLVQAFTQSKFALGNKFEFTGGVHYIHLLLNNSFGIDPRAGLSYRPNSATKFTIGYGHHSRVEDLSVYYTRDRNGNLINNDLGLLKSHQAVIGASRMLTSSLRLSGELYYLYLYDVPVQQNGSYSVLGLFGSLPIGDLVNDGFGENYGVEVNLQRFTVKGFYYMLSGALFNARYRGGDGVWRNTEYNQRYSYNLIAGKEFELKPKDNKRRLLGVNANFRQSGGVWLTPIDLAESREVGWTILDQSNPNSLQQQEQYNLDFAIILKKIRTKVSSELSLSIKNLTSNQAVLTREFDPDSDSIIERTDYGVIPVIGYTLHF